MLWDYSSCSSCNPLFTGQCHTFESLRRFRNPRLIGTVFDILPSYYVVEAPGRTWGESTVLSHCSLRDHVRLAHYPVWSDRTTCAQAMLGPALAGGRVMHVDARVAKRVVLEFEPLSQRS